MRQKLLIRALLTSSSQVIDPGPVGGEFFIETGGVNELPIFYVTISLSCRYIGRKKKSTYNGVVMVQATNLASEKDVKIHIQRSANGGSAGMSHHL